VLPSRAGWVVLDGAVYWPVGTHPQASLVANANASDHRLVWLEVRPAVSLEEAVVGLDAAWNGSAVRLTWHGSTGYRYAVEEAAELAEGNWKPVVGAVVSGSASAGFSVALVPEAGGRWYYRLRVSFSEGG
jgi:hypothetical protein